MKSLTNGGFDTVEEVEDIVMYEDLRIFWDVV